MLLCASRQFHIAEEVKLFKEHCDAFASGCSFPCHILKMSLKYN